MRRFIAVALGLAMMVALVPAAFAQAPAAPQINFQISGLVDQLTSASKNMGDGNFTRSGDTEWYGRTRGRFDFIGKAGTAMAVLGIEVDTVYGQTGQSDTNVQTTGATGAASTPATPRFGDTSSFDLNTDTQGSIEVKWLFTEFDAPWNSSNIAPSRIRLGAQPFSVTYKPGVFATGDFAGMNILTTWSPNVKSQITFAQIEENLSGVSTGGGRPTLGGGRGDDFALILMADITPIKGLDIRPIYALVYLQNSTSGSVRTGTATNAISGLGFAQTATNSTLTNVKEWRHYIGFDGRFRKGPFSFDPTAFVQFGTADVVNPFAGASATDRISQADIFAWMTDIKAGYRIGPLLIEGRYVYASGNRGRDQLHKNINYFTPIDTDTGFWSDGWGQIFALGVDYLNGSLRNMGVAIGFDRYGRQQFGAKATYSVTPALDLYVLGSPAWTARSVDTDGVNTSTLAQTVGTVTCTANSSGSGSGCRGDNSYLGTEVDAGLTWRFAPGLQFDLVGAYLFAGGALDSTEVVAGVSRRRSAENVYLGTARVRITF